MELETLDFQTTSSKKKSDATEQSTIIIEQIHLLILKMQVQVQERIDELWLLENHAKKRADGFVEEHKQIQEKTIKEFMVIQERTEKILTEIRPHLNDVSETRKFLFALTGETRDMLKEFTRNLPYEMKNEMQSFYNKTIRMAVFVGTGTAILAFTLDLLFNKIF